MVKLWKDGAALTVQKYLKGQLGRNKFMSYKRYNLVDDLAGQVQAMQKSLQDRCGLDLQVKLWYHYNKYKKRKAEEKRKKKAAAEKAKGAKKKGGKYGGYGGGYKAPAKPAAGVNLGKAATQMAGQVATKIAADANKVTLTTT